MNRFLSPALLVPALCLGLWGTARPAAAALSANGVLENITLLAHPYTALFGTDAKPTSAAALSPQQCLDKVKQEWLAYQKTEGQPGPPGSVPPADQSQRQTLYEGVRNICLQRLALEQEFALLQRQPDQGPADPNGPLAPKSRPQPAPSGGRAPQAAPPDVGIIALYALEADNYKMRLSLDSADELIKKNGNQLLLLQKQLLVDQEALTASVDSTPTASTPTVAPAPVPPPVPASAGHAGQAARAASPPAAAAAPPPVAVAWAQAGAQMHADLTANQALYHIRLGEFLQQAQRQARQKIAANTAAIAELRPRVRFDELMLHGITDALRDRIAKRQNMMAQDAQRLAISRLQNPSLTIGTLFWNQLLAQFQADLDNKNQQIWQWRYDLYNDSAHSPQAISSRLATQAADLQAINLTVNSLMDDALARRPASTDAVQSGSAAVPSEIDAALQEQLINTLSLVNETQQNMSILSDEITRTLELVNPARRLFDQLWLQLQSAFHLFWDFNLFTLKEQLNVNGQDVVTTQNITVGKSLGAIVVLVVGYLVGAWLLNLLREFAVRSLGLGERTARQIYKGALAVLVATLVVLSLNLVHIPLSVFTLFGGVLAVGLGFGAQSLVKNLIGALILQLTHPVRIGDYIVVNQHSGYVKQMGWQFCVVRGFDGDESIISNMELLSGSVVNWTYQDKNMRRTVAVGVAYGSPAQQVVDLLLAAAADTPEALKDPPPKVYFNDFGDSTLSFQLKYWIELKNVSPSVTDSDVRRRINDALNAAGIVMAFPQRDLHLYQDQPFTVALAAQRRPPAGEGAAR